MDRVYVIYNPESARGRINRHPTEDAQVEAANKNSEAIGVRDYAMCVLGRWRVWQAAFEPSPFER